MMPYPTVELPGKKPRIEREVPVASLHLGYEVMDPAEHNHATLEDHARAFGLHLLRHGILRVVEPPPYKMENGEMSRPRVSLMLDVVAR